MSATQATAAAGPNIALIKYWGNRDPELRIPASGSISLTLAALEVVTSVAFLEGQKADRLAINGTPASPAAAARVTKLLDVVRQASGLDAAARVDSTSNFPAGTGIASSAAAFAALAAAAVAAAGLQMDDQALSRLARRGSGSACRSVFGGYVEWIPGEDDAHSFAQPLQPPEHWRLVDVIAVVDETPKAVSSTQGHALAPTSPLQNARLEGAPERLRRCRRAIEQRDFEALAEIVELNSEHDACGDDDVHATASLLATCHAGHPASDLVMAAERHTRLLHDGRRPHGPLLVRGSPCCRGCAASRRDRGCRPRVLLPSWPRRATAGRGLTSASRIRLALPSGAPPAKAESIHLSDIMRPLMAEFFHV